MGNQCCTKQSSSSGKIYSTKALMNMGNFNSMDMYFSTQNLSRLEGECLVVFTDRRFRIKKTNLAAIINKKQTSKVKQQIEAYLYQRRFSNINNQMIDSPPPLLKQKTSSRSQIQQQQQTYSCSQNTSTKGERPQPTHFVIDIDLPTIKFTKLLVILVEPWEGKTSVKKLLENQIVTAMQSILQKGITEVAFIQFDDQLGIAANIGAAILARSIHNMSDKLKIATICCKNIADQLTYFSFFQNFKQQKTLTSYTRKSIGSSNYY